MTVRDNTARDEQLEALTARNALLESAQEGWESEREALESQMVPSSECPRPNHADPRNTGESGLRARGTAERA